MSYCVVVDSGSLIKNGQIKDVYVVPMTITKTDKNQT
jgi:fatty acid-binding protein DegV